MPIIYEIILDYINTIKNTQKLPENYNALTFWGWEFLAYEKSIFKE